MPDSVQDTADGQEKNATKYLLLCGELSYNEMWEALDMEDWLEEKYW